MQTRVCNMITWGINALNHGSSIALFRDKELLSNTFYSNDRLDKNSVIEHCKQGIPDEIYWYERPLLKKLRQLYAGQWRDAVDLSVLPKRHLEELNLRHTKIYYTPHHASHAAAGYYTSPFDRCAVVVLDAIGEFECASVWQAEGQNLKKIWSRDYPHSIGLFYSAFTKLIGFRPVIEEYQLQKHSELGDPNRFYQKVRSYFGGNCILTYNFHRGVRNWDQPILCDQDRWDIAAAVQRVFEDQIASIMTYARSVVGTDSLVYMGGCAMNSFANKKVVEPLFDKIWSLPQPGDPSSSIGAVLYHKKYRIDWQGALAKHIEIKV
jgi:carbamoyltransferase